MTMDMKRQFKCSVRYGGTSIMNVGQLDVPLPSMQSMCYYDINIGSQNIIIARCLVVKLMAYPYDTADGITVSADMPFGKCGLVNISRPAVLRTYYGLDKTCISATLIERVTYGPTSFTGCLATDPRWFSTKPMSILMYNFGVTLKNFSREQFQKQKQDTKIFDCEFNHCTILIYNGHTPNVNNQLTYHCDYQYDHDGQFMDLKNSQGKNTPVIIYSLGDTRTICFRRRIVKSSKESRKCWEAHKHPFQKIDLNDNSMFVLHPMDEKPILRYPTESLSQFQHGNISLKTGCLSIALVFRNVTNTLIYDNVTSRRAIDVEWVHTNSSIAERYNNTYRECTGNIIDIEETNHDHTQQKIAEWNWT